jgi:hypothetical protein
MQKKLQKGESYRLVGLGTMLGDERCLATGTKATGYIEQDGDMVPVNLKLFGSGKMGEYIEFLGEEKTHQ